MYAVRAANACGPIPNSLNNALPVIDFDKVADTNGPLGHQDPAADEVVDDVLCTEANADGQSAGSEMEGRQRYAQKSERGKDDDNKDRKEHDALEDVDEIRPHLGVRKALAEQIADKSATQVAEKQ